MSKVPTDEAKIHLATKVDAMYTVRRGIHRRDIIWLRENTTVSEMGPDILLEDYNPADMDSAHGGKYLKALVKALEDEDAFWSYHGPLDIILNSESIVKDILQVTGFKGKTGLE